MVSYQFGGLTFGFFVTLGYADKAVELVRTDAQLGEIHERQRSQVEAALLRIVESPEFRGSRRSIDFLSYAVGKWLDRDLPSLKETTIATEVFHKSSTYDPAEDSFVRVKANDMRKRLSAYYEGSGQIGRAHV